MTIVHSDITPAIFIYSFILKFFVKLINENQRDHPISCLLSVTIIAHLISSRGSSPLALIDVVFAEIPEKDQRLPFQ